MPAVRQRHGHRNTGREGKWVQKHLWNLVLGKDGGGGAGGGDMTLSAMGRENESRLETKMRRAFNFVERKRKLLQEKEKVQ